MGKTHLHYTKDRENGKHLDYQERQYIDYLIKKAYPKKVSVKLLSEQIGCSESTVRRELVRGKVMQLSSDLIQYTSYSADVAQESYDYRASNKGPELKISNDYNFVKYVEDKILKHGYSPDAIIMELENTGFIDPSTDNEFKTKISTKTLYNYISPGIFPNLTNEDLPREGKGQKRKQRRIRRSYRSVGGKSIWERPNEANERIEAGHWEMDCMEGPKGKDSACLLTMVDRKLRTTMIFKLPDQTQESVINVLDKLERKMGRVKFAEKFKTITVDNGSEFLNFKGLERSQRNDGKKRTNIYFCHPYSSWERGSNEHTNGMIRRFIPKGTAISPILIKDIKKIEAWLNNYPRRIFNGKSSLQKQQEYTEAA